MYNEETVMMDLDMENEVGSIYSFNDNMTDYTVYSQYTDMAGTDFRGKDSYGRGKYSSKNKKSQYELIGQDHYRTVVPIKGKRPMTVEFYLTKYYPGVIIRDAVTGRYEKARVGKCDEDLYFKVKLSMGGDTAGHLYYSSPEEYERHWHTDVSVDIKQKWLEKYTAELEVRNKEPDEMTMREYTLIH